MRKIINEDFQLKKDGYIFEDPFSNKKVSVYYKDKAKSHFWLRMVDYAISDYVEKEHDWSIEYFLNDRGFYIFDDNDISLKISADFSSEPYQARIARENGNVDDEVVYKYFTTYEELVYEIIECFDKFITTGHIEEQQETPEADPEKVKTLKLMHSVARADGPSNPVGGNGNPPISPTSSTGANSVPWLCPCRPFPPRNNATLFPRSCWKNSKRSTALGSKKAVISFLIPKPTARRITAMTAIPPGMSAMKAPGSVR